MKITTLKEAKAQGLKHYFTGQPCSKGHLAVRYVSGKGCSVCARERTNQWRKDNPESQGKWHRENPDRAKDTRLQRIYGITLAVFNFMKQQQKDRCSICQKIFIETPHVDHDHETGKVRELLCERCNHMIGHALDNPALLRAAANYLERHQA